MSNEEILENILSGTYRLHEFAATMWLALTEKSISLNREQPLLDTLIDLLSALFCQRNNNRYTDADQQDCTHSLKIVKDRYPELHSDLCKSVQFRDICAKSDYKKTTGE